MNEKIFNRYTNPENPGSFGSKQSFLKNNPDIPKKSVDLSGIEAFNLHSKVTRKFDRIMHII